MKRRYQILVLSLPILAILALYTIFRSTDPLSVGPGGVLVVFMLIYVVCLGAVFALLRFGLYGIRYWIARKGGLSSVNKHKKTGNRGSRKAYYVASVVAFLPVTLIAMRAYSQLQVADLLLVSSLVIIVVFYILKRE